MDKERSNQKDLLDLTKSNLKAPAMNKEHH